MRRVAALLLFLAVALFGGGALASHLNGAGGRPLPWPSSPEIDPPDRFLALRATGSEGRESYQPFGKALRIFGSAPANDNNTGFTGHLEDDASGLVYMQARHYDPLIGRFLSTDPIGYQDQLNLYAYVANDPVNNWDPTGEARFGLFLDAKLFYGAGAKGRVELSVDTESKEIRLDVSAGAGVGLRAGVEAGGFVEESRTDGTSVSGKVSVEASAAAEFKPTPLGGEIGGKLNIVEGSASTENGLQGGAFRPEAIVEGSVGPVTVDSDRVSASIGIDVGASASVDVSVGASLSVKPLFDQFEKER